MENKKTTNKKANKVLERQDSYNGVILEEIKGDIKTLLEGNDLLHTRIDRLDGKVNQIEVKVDNLEVKVDVLNEKFDGVETKFDSLAKDFRQKADKTDVITLGHRVTKLEAQ